MVLHIIETSLPKMIFLDFYSESECNVNQILYSLSFARN